MIQTETFQLHFIPLTSNKTFQQYVEILKGTAEIAAEKSAQSETSYSV
jgi:hypothetical protein